MVIIFIACKPAMRMTKLTTIPSTGRLMNRSVNDFMLDLVTNRPASDLSAAWVRDRC